MLLQTNANKLLSNGGFDVGQCIALEVVAVVPLVATAKMPPELSVRTRKGKTHLNSKRLTSCNGNQHFCTVV